MKSGKKNNRDNGKSGGQQHHPAARCQARHQPANRYTRCLLACHYTPALDRAHLGPLGPDDPETNGKEQKIHQSNSCAMHGFYAQFTDLFADDMPAPDNPRRLDPATGQPVVNSFVKEKLNQSCYQCHPGRETQ